MNESVYINLWNKINENYMTAPEDSNGNPQPSFMKHLELMYSPEEAGLLQYMKRPGQFTTTEEVSEVSGKPLKFVEDALDRLHKRNSLIGMGNFYSLLPIPLLLNHHMFYPEVKPEDIEA
ncbi:MAG: hypothetical protein HN737_08490, partial [Desulfobacterales bacterium]|nr:hypothetical protein [Desulfobacterales bacterium]